MTRKIWHIVVFTFASLVFASPAMAESPTSGWDSCKMDTDCVIQQDPCGGYITTNAKKVNAAKKWFEKNKEIYEMCTMQVHEKPAGARCGEYNVCEIMQHKEASADSPSDSWQQCHNNADCTIVRDPCGRANAYNVQNQIKASTWYSKHAKVYSCFLPKKLQPAKSYCGNNNICKIVNNEKR